jgi:hypothetical protein
MSPSRDDDERERLSWREIDQRRERPGQRTPARERPAKKQAELLRKLALQQAEALFTGKRGRPEYQKALKELEATRGTKKFIPTVRKFLEEYGLPAEWGALNLLLDFPDAAVASQALQAMADQFKGRSRVEQQGFKGRLKVLHLTSGLAPVRKLAEELLNKIE